MRKMKKSLLYLMFVLLIIFSGYVGCSIQNKNNLEGWIGKYTYGASSPPAIPGGIRPYEAYIVSIYLENDKYYADITADGWMLGIRAKAQIQGDENSIELVFLEYPDASMEPFQKGDVILRFTRSEQDIITKWVSIAPGLGSDKEAEGIYFVKNTIDEK